MRCLRQVAFVALTAGVAAGCSSDFIRFNPDAYSASAPIQSTGYSNNADVAANPYPGGIDATTTASIGAPGGSSHAAGGPAPVPAGSVDGQQPLLQSMQAKPAYRKAPITATRTQATQLAADGEIRPINRAPVRSAQLQPAALPPDVDPMVTASTAPAAAREPAAPKPAGKAGWTGTGGTTIIAREGETLYNISKRYGVPVHELMRVNAIDDADHVRVGQRIVIPTYVYSKRAPVSAPDNHPKTRASRASTGLHGENRSANVAVPTPNPSLRARVEQVVTAAPRAQTPQYTVRPGDTLSAVAVRHNVPMSQLMAANKLENFDIRAGQTLTIPPARPRRVAARTLPAGVDPVVTGSTGGSDNARPAKQPQSGKADDEVAAVDRATQTPSATGIGRFRWPVTGRVISGFGQARGGGPNDGIDISVPEGTAVKAAENGLVIYSGDELEGFGNLVLIRHEDGWVSAYAHNKQLEVARGDKVRRGQIIARSGRTGDAELPMVHFELRKDSNPVDPQQFLTR